MEATELETMAAELHPMDAELIEARATVRFTCQVCTRCVESGPDGIRVLDRGDQHVQHFGGNVALHTDLASHAPKAQPLLH